MFIFRKTTAETNECDSESSSWSFHRASQQNRFVCWWWQRNNPSRSTKYLSSQLSRMRTDREAQGKAGGSGKDKGPGLGNSYAIFGKTEGPWERIGAWVGEFLCNFGKTEGPWERIGVWGGEFLCNFGHRWEVDKINKQRKELEPSIPSSLLLVSRKVCLKHITKTKILSPKNVFSPQTVKPDYVPAKNERHGESC